MSGSLNVREFIKRHLYLFLFFCSAFLTSCEMFNRSVPEYLEYYTSEVRVLTHSFDGTYQTNTNSVVCISSDDSHYVNLEFLNLKNYDVGFEFVFDEDSVKEAAGQGDVSFQLSEDRNSAKIIFSKTLLSKLDKGQVTNADGIVKNLSGTLILYQNENGTNVRNFSTPYHIDVNANSAPSRIKGACMLADGIDPHGSSSDTRKLYICFNMQNFAGTEHQNDTENLYIAGKHFTINYSGSSITVKDDEDNILAASFGGDLYEVGEEDSTHVSSFKTTDYDGFIKYYYDTGILAVNSDASQKYEIKIVDNYGLSSSVNVSARSEKLKSPFITVDNEVDPDTETKTVTITHDPQTRAGNICAGTQYITYRIVDSSTGNEIISTTNPVASPATVKVPAGSYTVYASASCEEYIDSDESNETVSFGRSKVYYVKNGGSTDADGSKNKPFAKITACLSAIKTRTSLSNDHENYLSATDECTIKLLSGITENEINFNSSNLGSVRKIVLDGCGHSINANKEWRILSVASGFDVVLTDVTLTGAGETLASFQIVELQYNNNSNISVSGNLYLCNGTKIVNNYTVCNRADSYTSSLISVGAGGQLFAEGKVIISGNKFADDNNLASNLYLQSDQVINCSYKMKDENGSYYSMEGSEIHVSICNALNDTTNTSQTITKNFKANAGFSTVPGVFVSDQEYSAARDSSNLEVCFCRNAIETQIQNFEDIQICTDRKVIPVVPTGATSVDSLRTVNAYVTHNGKRVEATDWSIAIYSGGGPLTGPGVTSSTSSIQFNNDLTESEYQLLITATYKGKPYNVYKTIKAVMPIEMDVNKSSLRNAMTASDADEKIIKLVDGSGTVSFTDAGWLPVDEFKGVLDGNGRTIKMPKQNNSNWDAGLAVINKGVIQNITIEVDYSGVYSEDNRESNYGCISNINYGTIKNCRSIGTLTVGTYSDVGGICRVNYGLIENCYSEAHITNNNTRSYWQFDFGMIAGIAAINGSDDMVGIIRNCVFNGTLYTPRTFAQYDSANGRFGAIAGRNGSKGVIENCYWKENCVIWRQGNYDSGTDLYYNKVAFFFTDYGFNGCNKDECLGTVSGCGYFANTSSNVQAGSAAECKTNQSLISGASGNIYNYLNKYVDNHPNDGLKKWKSDLSYQ